MIKTVLAMTFLVVQMAYACEKDFTSKQWVGTWASNPQKGETIIPGLWEPSIPQTADATLRQIVRTTISGKVVRVRFSNEFGETSLKIGAASIALSAGGGIVQPNTIRPLTFGGKDSITIPPGAPAVSDPVLFDLPASSDLAISIYLPDATPSTTYHYTGLHTTYLSTSGNHTNDEVFATAAMSSNYYFLTGVSVLGSKIRASIAAFGNSIADGYNSTVDANKAWPSVLAARLQNGLFFKHLSVLNCGISGNRILNDQIGPNALSRMDRDVLRQPGLKYIIFMMGINDIGFSGGALGFPPQPVTADEIIDGQRQVIARAHESGYKIFGATLTPTKGVGAILGGTYDTPEGEAKRQAVNNWIRTGGEYDGVIDFDKVIRDPSDTLRILPEYDSGDHLHPNDAGYEAMGNSINLNLFVW